MRFPSGVTVPLISVPLHSDDTTLEPSIRPVPLPLLVVEPFIPAPPDRALQGTNPWGYPRPRQIPPTHGVAR